MRACDAANKVRVAVRVRPALAREVVGGAFHGCLACVPTARGAEAKGGDRGGGAVFITTADRPLLVDKGQSYDGQDGVRRFCFDRVFDQDTRTASVYDACCKDLVKDVLNGVNGTVFAYGQTGTGKTHTLLGTPGEPGVVALAARDLFRAGAAMQSSASGAVDSGNVHVEVSYAQIYNQVVSDLFKPPAQGGASSRDSLALRESATTGEVVVQGLTHAHVSSLADVLALVERGGRNRKVISTALNSTSSRSHAVLTFYVSVEKQRVEKQPTSDDSASDGSACSDVDRTSTGRDGRDVGSCKVVTEFTTAKLHVVDLAGSERVKDSAVDGQNLRDACNINLSLFHLATVVNALATNSDSDTRRARWRGRDGSGSGGGSGGGGGSGSRCHVPYKNDKLCFLLKDALGGNCLTALVATVSPAQLHARESLGTLQFASCCARVQNRATRQVVRRRRLAPHRSTAAAQAKEPEPEVPWVGVLPGDATRCPGGRITVATAQFGALSCLAFGNPQAPLALCLHGYPSCAEACYGQFLLPALVHAGFYAVALDMPGCGRSPPGPNGPLRTRSEFNLAPNGAADVVAAAIAALLRRRQDQEHQQQQQSLQAQAQDPDRDQERHHQQQQQGSGTRAQVGPTGASDGGPRRHPAGGAVVIG